jgi:hypothetical protein
MSKGRLIKIMNTIVAFRTFPSKLYPPISSTIGFPEIRRSSTRITASVYITTPYTMKSSPRAYEDVPGYAIYGNITGTIGRTPIVKLQRMSPKEGVDVYPGGSVKDRLTIGCIEWAEHHGQLKPGDTIVEASCRRPFLSNGVSWCGFRARRLFWPTLPIKQQEW